MSCFGLNLNLGDVVAVDGYPDSDKVTFVMQSAPNIQVSASPDPGDPFTINFEYEDSTAVNPEHVPYCLSVPSGQHITACSGGKKTRPHPVKARLIKK